MSITNSSCPTWTLPKGGYLKYNSDTFYLDRNATYIPVCLDQGQPQDPKVFFAHADPFYSSVLPQMYALGTATFMAYFLFIILVITPRTFFVAGRGGGGASFLGRRGMIAGSYGGASVIGVGGRPWLQKVAALTVTISLTIASAHTFSVAQHQYERHFMDSTTLTQKVLDSIEIRIVRVISITFLWLAQVQTLIRLFPRHKEKVAIKWIGFALIVLDTVFTILNNFTRDWRHTINFAGSIRDAVSALNYLFELSLSCLYAAWVIFYSISKHRFAFFNPKMKNICLVAALSLCAVLIPVVFFVLDISKPDISPWGEYIRWVGAAAASVTVWEWVERIEALERDERKDGILGREVFDADDMLDAGRVQEIELGERKRRKSDGDEESDAFSSDGGGSEDDGGRGGVAARRRGRFRLPRRLPTGKRYRSGKRRRGSHDSAVGPRLGHAPRLADGTETPSVDGTVYRMRCRSVSLMRSLHEEDGMEPDLERGLSASQTVPQSDAQTVPGDGYGTDGHLGGSDGPAAQPQPASSSHSMALQKSPKQPSPSTSMLTRGMHLVSALNIFRRKRTTPPVEVVNAQREADDALMRAPISHDGSARVTFDAGAALPPSQHLARSQGRLHSLRRSSSSDRKQPLPLISIPASPRRGRRQGGESPLPSFIPDLTDGHTMRSERPATGLPVIVIPARSRRAAAAAAAAADTPPHSGGEGAQQDRQRPRSVRSRDDGHSGSVSSQTDSQSSLRRSAELTPAPDQTAYHQDRRIAAAGDTAPRDRGHGRDRNRARGASRYFSAEAEPPPHGRSPSDAPGSPVSAVQQLGVERYLAEDAEISAHDDDNAQVIRVSTSMSSLFSAASSSDDAEHDEPAAARESLTLHTPIPQAPPLAYQAAARHRQLDQDRPSGWQAEHSSSASDLREGRWQQQRADMDGGPPAGGR
ncbi:pH-response regulator protein palH/rim21 [Ascosphaera acerosa]|nr:pH-response regulator protein palH/rim21 [Ascosphaera acerosa]